MDSQRKSTLGFAVILSVLFLILTWPAILSHSPGIDRTGGAGDQNDYHLPLILKKAHNWPNIDLNDLGGCQMTPTYHVIMAALAHYANLNVTGLRMVNSLYGLALVLAVFWFARKWTSAPVAFALSVTYLFSPFMISAAIWLMTDNLAWFFVVLALGGAAMHATTPRRIIGNGVAAMAATAVRQIHLWLNGPIVLATMMELLRSRFPGLAPTGSPPRSRPAALILTTAIAILLPAAALLFYVSIWHSLIPPNSAKPGMNNHFKIIPLALAQAGFCCLFLAPAVLPGALKLRWNDWRIWAGAAICTLLAAIPRSAEQQNPSGALVDLAGHTPVMFDRLLILLPPAAIAGAALVAFFLAAQKLGRGRPAFLILVGFVCWLMAQTAPIYVFRRYCDIVQILVIWLAALCIPPEGPRLRFWGAVGAFSFVQAGFCFVQIFLPLFRAL